MAQLLMGDAAKVLPSDGRFFLPYLRHSADHSGGGLQSRGQVNRGPLDPWAYRIVHAQNAKDRATAARVNPTTASVNATGFSWRDAAIGAPAAVLLMMLLAGGLAARRRRILAAQL